MNSDPDGEAVAITVGGKYRLFHKVRLVEGCWEQVHPQVECFSQEVDALLRAAAEIAWLVESAHSRTNTETRELIKDDTCINEQVFISLHPL